MKNLFELIEEKGMKPRTLALALGISEGNFSEWKSGKRIPNAATLIKIADYLDCSVDYLLDRDDVPNRQKKRRGEKAGK